MPTTPGTWPRPGTAITSASSARLVSPSPAIARATNPTTANATATAGETGPPPRPGSFVMSGAVQLRTGLEGALVLALGLFVWLGHSAAAPGDPRAAPECPLPTPHARHARPP